MLEATRGGDFRRRMLVFGIITLGVPAAATTSDAACPDSKVPTLTQEDVMRLTQDKIEEAEIVEQIEDAWHVQFDLERNVELFRGGVSNRVIRAMFDRVYPPRKQLAPGARFDDCNGNGWCPKMVVVPAGEFCMGSSPDKEGRDRANEGPQTSVKIAEPFAVGMYEVTRGEFKYFVQESEYQVTTDKCWGDNDTSNDSWNWKDPGTEEGDSHPVVCVSWDDAIQYTKWLSQATDRDYRLLNEAEWEYMARAETTTGRYWDSDGGGSTQCKYENGIDQSFGNYSGDLGPRAECCDGMANTAPVGHYEPNPYGIYDVLGNAREWVRDCYYSKHPGKPVRAVARLHPDENECKRMTRGGSWGWAVPGIHAAFRAEEDRKRRFVGFRVARSID